MASVHFQNLKRGRDEFWHGGAVLPQPKRSNSGGHDADLIALLERIDDITPDGGLASKEVEEEERLSVVMKSLQDEIGLKPSADSDGGGGCEEGGDEVSNNGGAVVDGNSDATTSVSDVGDLYYDDVRAEFCFFADHTAGAEELGLMGTFEGGHSVTDIYNTDVFHAGYAENNTEVFYGSLWEDDIWQLNVTVNDHTAASCSNEDGDGSEATQFHDVGNDIMRPIQCLSASEEAS